MLAGILEVPVVRRLPAWVIDWRILRPMRYATGGTILACRLALEHGVAINLGGGYHHAAAGWGGGFCVYADVPLAAKILHDEGKVGRVLVVDLDAHQGNGTAAVFQGWPWASIYDLYERDIFPARKEPEDFPLPVGPGLTGAEYLGIVRDTLPGALDAVPARPRGLQRRVRPVRGRPAGPVPADGGRPGRAGPARRGHGPGAGHPAWRWSSRAATRPSRGGSTPTPSRAS